MDKETWKIAKACFIGGVLCGATAFLLAPMFWWLGTLAGLAGGYFGYEFREVLRAIPKAWGVAQLEMDSRLPKMIWAIGNFLRRPHPFGYLSLVITITIFYVASTVDTKNMIFRSLPLGLLWSGLLWFTSWILVFIVADVGASKEKCYFMIGNHFIIMEGTEGSKQVRLTYGNAIYYVVKGFGLIFLFFAWKMWKYLFIGIKHAGIFIARFLKNFLILVHSSEKHKRVFCAITGTLGGIAAFLWLAPSAETLVAKVMVVIFGGLLGAAFGVIMRELSLRWLSLAAST